MITIIIRRRKRESLSVPTVVSNAVAILLTFANTTPEDDF